jgi:SAM-dependent methyltransferase
MRSSLARSGWPRGGWPRRGERRDVFLVDREQTTAYDLAPHPQVGRTQEGAAMTAPDDEALIADPATAWDAAAPAWDDFVETGLDYWRTEVHGPALLAACGDVAGRRALDLGCGQGWFSRRLAAHGARVVGIDLSSAQIDNARRHEAAHPLGIVYERRDAVRIAERWPPGSFDLIAACMSLHDTAHAGAILRAARQILAADGRIAFSITHPVTSGPDTGWTRAPDGSKGARWLDRYFETGPAVLHWRMARLPRHWSTPQWHRTLSEWSALVRAAGLTIDQLDEPQPTPDQIARDPRLEPARRVPYFLIVTLRASPGAA